MFNLPPTEKQLNYAIYLIESGANNGSQTFKKFWDEFPKNNNKYPDIRADYRRAILNDLLAQKSSEWVNALIGAILRSDYKQVINMLGAFRR